ncbi:stealth conserved region 3 domain-containing protein [Paracoccus shandongensis]|uniref:stealth conserved region 3 domain-containing protein n=1 Tax=Paracoccus shandongensis TaxID=2816048 RepID=UPI001A903E68|nr:stealth conserved region 3 domain-containing protein [Paracoccus shandongensis]
MWDYSLVAIAHPGLLKEAARTIVHRKSRRLVSELRAVDTTRNGPVKAAPVDPRSLLDMLAEETGVLVLRDNPGNIWIGISDTDFLRALVRLQLSVASGKLMSAGKTVRLTSSSERQAALREPNVVFTFPGPGLEEASLTIESYALRTDGVWISGNANNRLARALYSDILLQPGLHPLSEILPGPPLDIRAEERPVDVVYTWVNHKDPDWVRLYQDHKSAADGRDPAHIDDHVSDDAKAISRFHSIDELRFSLRSVAKNLPWVRKIHVFTNCAVPDWLKEQNPRIAWVDHSQVIPEEYLPTFSSHVIESFLHRIPDLADQFIYLNDDVFIAKPLGKDFFFDAGGLSRSFLEGYGMVSGPVRIGDPDYLNASRNSARLIHQAFGVFPTRLHNHTAFALRRDVLQEIEDRWSREFHAFRRNRFRMPSDLNMTSFLYHHYAMNTGRATDTKIKMALVKQLDVRWKNRLSNAMNQDIETICINEGGSGTPSWDWHDSVLDFLKTFYPMKADWER